MSASISMVSIVRAHFSMRLRHTCAVDALAWALFIDSFAFEIATDADDCILATT